ncbi:hypothetical protein BMJ29_35175 [Sinorhizobium medicae]|uniref:Transmembrane protein n=1 Tax=Sinorhizobium medicae TaxID=110321 RepID=A0ABX4TNE9_9HYPH|nr:hypothetical protein BMJ33_15465 [Sinorhizobium medicae]PLU10801.1 hypothetical protein BMJ29_35175 [Sinorhizobium medicae]PLU31887.1 hypothetical protein BMJ26_27200 [Sinorhizobium medicae]PLU50130.1 hypothetical protein BMJ25_08980 [Sinorhizobium medicae]PLU81862.1 hypothetical protein BMJ19_00575 [Sinorhizobium medicae]
MICCMFLSFNRIRSKDTAVGDARVGGRATSVDAPLAAGIPVLQPIDAGRKPRECQTPQPSEGGYQAIYSADCHSAWRKDGAVCRN